MKFAVEDQDFLGDDARCEKFYSMIPRPTSEKDKDKGMRIFGT